MSDRQRLLAALADGAVHSRPELAALLAVPAARLDADCAALAAVGLEPERHGDGWRLAAALDLIDAARLETLLAAATRSRLGSFACVPVTGSTNADLLAAGPPPPGSWRALIAEYQSAGRGRRGRHWVAPYASGLMLSFGWRFAGPATTLAPLGLAAGVAVLRALAASGVTGVALKWPNDILLGAGKLGGILCELRTDESAAYVVVGIGLNVRLPAAAAGAIAASGGLAPAALGSAAPDRTRLAARLIDALVTVAVEFETQGFAALREEWLAADALAGQCVRVLTANATQDGIARGIDARGALRLEVDGRIDTVVAGDVTLRLAA